MPTGQSPARTVGATVALVLLGALTGLLGTAVHLAREDVLGVLLPYGVLLALAMVLACDITVAAASLGRRPGPGHALLAVAAHFATAPPAHSLLIAALDAEEAGLQGARALLREPPVPVASKASMRMLPPPEPLMSASR